MSRCWCKCEAGLGQCGPKVPRLKSLFGSPKPNDDASLRRWDRQAELEVIWDEIGEGKDQKLNELRQMIAAAVDKIYDRALEEGVRRRTALEENVLNSEKRLAEILGPDSAKLSALGDVDMEFMLSWLSTQEGLTPTASSPSQLPLQTRLDMNMAKLHELDSERLGAYGWVGGLVVMVELRHRVLLLRETLNLPPCDPLADLDKVLVKTMEDLNALYPGKAATLQYSETPPGEQKPVLQRLQKFYQALRAIESTWVESFTQKNSAGFNGGPCSTAGGGASCDGDGLHDHMEKAALLRLRNIEEKRSARKRTRDVQRHKSESPLGNGILNFGSVSKSQSSSKNKITRANTPNTPSSEDSHSLELLSQNIISKIDKMNQHLKLTGKGGSSESASCSSSTSSTSTTTIITQVVARSADPTRMADKTTAAADSSGGGARLSKSDLQLQQKTGDQHHLLPPPSQPPPQPPHSGKSVRTHSTSVRSRAAAIAAAVAASVSAANSTTGGCGGPSAILLQRNLHHPAAEKPIEVGGLQQADLLQCTARENQGLGKVKPADLFGACVLPPPPPPPAADAAGGGVTVTSTMKPPPSKSPLREPLRTLPNCTAALVSNPGVAKRPPGAAAPPSSAPPPPPPPPPPLPPSGGGPGFVLLKKQSSNLKRSVKMSRLYRNLKTKIEGAAHVHAIGGPGATSRRLSTAGTPGTREGMAEALAEITKKSTYFQKIENDVQRYHDSIEESKRELDNFETADMDQLLRFHKKLESILENLTDETQVLARFKGFPSNKLETLRLAAALYSRLLSMAQELEKWGVEAQVGEQLDKITRYFDKIKKDLDVVEGTKEEDLKRFTNQKIKFDFSIIGRIKEAMVGLSSRCLVRVLEESKRTKGVDGVERGQAVADSNRQKACSHMLWRAFQLAYRVYNFAGGHDDQSERLISEIASEIETYPADVWL